MQNTHMHKIKTKLYKKIVQTNKQTQSSIVYSLSLITAACSGYLEALIILTKTQNRGAQAAVIYSWALSASQETTLILYQGICDTTCRHLSQRKRSH